MNAVRTGSMPLIAGERMLVQLTTSQLGELIRSAVLDALSDAQERPAKSPPGLLDRAGLARALGCSTGHVDRLCRRGLPYVRVGTVRRFDFSKITAWLAKPSAPPPDADGKESS